MHTTVVTPDGKGSPDRREQSMKGRASQLSLTVMAKGTGVPVTSAQGIVTSGHVITGGSVSLTMTWKVQLAVLLPEPARQVTLLVPLTKVEPLGGVQLAVTP